jgi:hypothetical protein
MRSPRGTAGTSLPSWVPEESDFLGHLVESETAQSAAHETVQN